ncbi:MAG: serine/threonine-protein kinase [Spirochaetales bacterium]|nr:serine/threonine-protein kinase [Spirochaetales bacterium]
MASVPEIIGKYKIESVVAVGGMGTVYKAVHPSLKRQVIIKKLTLKGGGGSIRERFKREAQILLDLSSPYVVRMFDYFTEGRSDYIVLEFVDGMSLDKLIQKQVALPSELALLIFLDACYGLKHAHAKGIVHRDIKPGNILISRRAEVKLADFGIASGEKESDIVEMEKKSGLLSKSESASKNGLTQTGATLGTPAYMSPEQFDDSRSVDQRADIYSMGVMLYEMVTGAKPYPGDMSLKTKSRIRKGDYIPPKKIDRTIPPFVCSLIKKMMRPKPSRRYQTIEPVIAKVKRFLKKYDTHQLRVELAQCIINSSSVTLVKMEPKKNYFPKITAAVLGIGLLAAGGFYCWKEGYVHATLLKNKYSPLYLTIRLPETASADSDLPVRAFFFENDNKDIPEVNGSRRVFFVDKNSSASSSASGEENKNDGKSEGIIYKTKPVYLKDGFYRIKVAAGPYIWWKSVEIKSNPLTVDINLCNVSKRQLTVHTTARDNVTGEDLTGKSKFKILYGNKYVDFSTVKPSALTTGAVYKFLVTCDGYKDEYFSLRLDWYQDELFINGSLTKDE